MLDDGRGDGLRLVADGGLLRTLWLAGASGVSHPSSPMRSDDTSLSRPVLP